MMDTRTWMQTTGVTTIAFPVLRTGKLKSTKTLFKGVLAFDLQPHPGA